MAWFQATMPFSVSKLKTRRFPDCGWRLINLGKADSEISRGGPVGAGDGFHQMERSLDRRHPLDGLFPTSALFNGHRTRIYHSETIPSAM